MSNALASRIAQAVEVARWAPSSHNCQPWRVVPISAETGRHYVRESGQQGETAWVVLALDRNRQLRALPSLETEMYVSCGMFLGLFWEALVAQGIECRVGWPDARTLEGELAELEDDFNLMPLTVIALNQQQSSDSELLGRLQDMAVTRRTLRGSYESEALPQDTLDQLVSARWPHAITGNVLNINVEQEGSWIARAAKLVRRYAPRDFLRYRVWRETHGFIHFDEDEPAEDGFYLSSLVGPVSDFERRLMTWCLKPPVMQALRFIGFPRLLAHQLGKNVEHSPQLLVASLPGEEQDAHTLVQAGTRLMEVWLQAHAQGLAIHPVSVVLQYDDARHELEKDFAPTERIVFFARLGEGEPTNSRNPRRRVADITAIPRGFPMARGPRETETPAPSVRVGKSRGKEHADTS